MKLLALMTLGLAALSSAQIPGFTGCPDYQPMADFDMDKFAGKWYESQRYFQVLEVGTRCVATDYKKLPDGKVIVANEVVTRITGIKRVMEGEVKNSGKTGEAKLSVRYTNLPVSFDTEYSILDTDYDNFAIAWSCSSFGPFSSNHAWVMTRKRNPTEAVLQRAYGVLDKFGISRTYFVRSDQSNCDLDGPSFAETPVKNTSQASSPSRKPTDSFTAATADAVGPIAALTAQSVDKPAASNPETTTTLVKSALTEPLLEAVPVPPAPVVDAPAEVEPHHVSSATQTKAEPSRLAVPLPLAVAAVAAPPAAVVEDAPLKPIKSSE